MKKTLLGLFAAVLSLVIAGCHCPCGCFSSCGDAKGASSPDKIGSVTSGELVEIVNSKTAVILDARSGKYDDGKRIPGAKALNEQSSPEDIAKIVPDKNTPVITYCGGPSCPASARLAEVLQKLGYTNIREYHDGIPGWIKAGNKVETVK